MNDQRERNRTANSLRVNKRVMENRKRGNKHHNNQVSSPEAISQQANNRANQNRVNRQRTNHNGASLKTRSHQSADSNPVNRIRQASHHNPANSRDNNPDNRPTISRNLVNVGRNDYQIPSSPVAPSKLKERQPVKPRQSLARVSANGLTACAMLKKWSTILNCEPKPPVSAIRHEPSGPR